MENVDTKNKISLRITCANADASATVFETAKEITAPSGISIKYPRDSSFDFEADWFQLFIIATSSRLAAMLIAKFVGKLWGETQTKELEKIEITVNNEVFLLNDSSELTDEFSESLDSAMVHDDEEDNIN